MFVILSFQRYLCILYCFFLFSPSLRETCQHWHASFFLFTLLNVFQSLNYNLQYLLALHFRSLSTRFPLFVLRLFFFLFPIWVDPPILIQILISLNMYLTFFTHIIVNLLFLSPHPSGCRQWGLFFFAPVCQLKLDFVLFLFSVLVGWGVIICFLVSIETT